ncbi:MAG: CRTAC1 family protein [Acidimicrobiia bacterium]|nr:CRTAC1 family protein [Acidimicrobiia bacterium]
MMLPVLLLSALVAQAVEPVRFRETAATAGVKFVLDNHASPDKQMIETMAGGMAAFDYDGDGRTDLFFTNGAAIPSRKKEAPKYWNRLYRNVTEPGGAIRFQDVTEQAGLAGEGYSMGAAAADFDNDGHVDLFVAGVYRNLLYRNLGNGKFEEITGKSGIQSDIWSVAGGWFDYDNDGLVDLLVVNYSNWSAEANRFCGDTARKIRVYCHPKYFDPVPNQLYRNLGGGRFQDVTAASGIGGSKGRGMSVAFADYDNDGRIDAFVTNDNLPNFLFRNLGGGKFEETGLLAGAALLDNGKPVASMGADFRDYNNDGQPDIIVTALAGETFPLFRNDGKGGFRDQTFASRLGPQTIRRSGWGVGFIDFNNDGWKDLFTANSHVNDIIGMFEALPYKEPNAVFANLGNGEFRDDSATFTLSRAHRGAAFADFNGDGRMDVAVSCLNEPAELWENVTGGGHHWIRLMPRGVKSNRDGIGARFRIGTQSNWMSPSVSYASSSHAGVHFGLGRQAGAVDVEVVWPSGHKQVEKIPGVDVVHVIEER